jgi:hypothetical protein
MCLVLLFLLALLPERLPARWLTGALAPSSFSVVLKLSRFVPELADRI